MNRSVLLILFLLAGTLAKSQSKFNFSGHITDSKTHMPLAGASVYFSELKKGAITNEKGEFLISSLSSGQYLLEVSYLGYASHSEYVNFEKNQVLDIALDPSVRENEGVTVTGVSSATSIKRSPIPVNILRKEDLFRNTSTNLIDNISKTPGVSQLSTGPAVSKPIIRGLGYNRVVVVNDGIRHEGQQWGDEHGVEVDELSAARVEILKGAASLMYGSDALAGVLNIISVQPAPEGVTRGNFLASYFTNNRQRNLHLDLGGNNNGFIWGVYGSYKGAGDYRNKYDGYVFNSKFNEKNFGGYIGLHRGWGFSHLVFSQFDQQFGLVEGERDPLSGKFVKAVNDNGVESTELVSIADNHRIQPFTPYQHLKHFKILVDNSIKAGRDRLAFTLGYQKDLRSEFGDVLHPAEKGLGFDMDVFNYNFQYHIRERKGWRTSLGLNGMAQQSKNKGIETLIPAYTLFDAGAFIYTQKRIKEFTLSGGIRFDNRSLKGEELIESGNLKFPAFKRQFSNISSSAGFTWQADKAVNLKFNLSRGFRAPSIPELSSNGAHEGTNRFEYGETDLRSEISWQADAGIEIGTEHVSFTGNLFLNRISHFIFYRKLRASGGGDSLIIDGPNTYYAFRFNQADANLYGAEFNLDIHPHPLDWLHFENTFSWVRGQLNKAVDGVRDLPSIPAVRIIDQVKLDILKKNKVFQHVFLMLELDNNFSQHHPFTAYNTETATAGYSLLNFAMGGDIYSSGKKLFSLVLAGNNLADVAYQQHLSRLKYTDLNQASGRAGVFNMGRNFSLKMNLPF